VQYCIAIFLTDAVRVRTVLLRCSTVFGDVLRTYDTGAVRTVRAVQCLMRTVRAVRLQCSLKRDAVMSVQCSTDLL
jgi:hypothetical protein